ncbi:hypothetical protein ES705_35688 [subsurface metagenome]
MKTLLFNSVLFIFLLSCQQGTDKAVESDKEEKSPNILLVMVDDMGELDNTMVMYLTADNGATAEGTPTGTCSELLMHNGFPPLTMDQQLELLERYGGLEE